MQPNMVEFTKRASPDRVAKAGFYSDNKIS